MSHICGTVESVAPNLHLGPDGPTPATGTNLWQLDFSYLPGGTKFIVLHFVNVTLPSNNRIEVALGYGTDIFTSANGGTFWTRPINIHQLGGATVPVRYITNGSNSGGAFIDMYGRGLSLQSFDSGHDSITNCDPFIHGTWTEPDFPHIAGSTQPKYDPYWICNTSAAPRWENARCRGDGTTQRQVSRSVGMILSIHEGSAAHPDPYVSTCSVTLIDSDLVALAAHCISDHPFSVPASSVTFDYEVLCDGSKVPAYNAVFYKVIKVVKYRYSDFRDYAILQLSGAPPLPPLAVKNGLPFVGEPVFGVHHPNGAVKKITPPGGATTPVISTSNGRINVNMDVAGGSSGSGLFDVSGRLLGVLASGGPCSIYYSSSELMLNDPIEIPDPPTQRAVMLVLDRSGSMTEQALGGGIKINEARDAAALFVSMLRAGMGNQAGLVSFASNASSPVEYPIESFTSTSRGNLLAELPGITPNGRTSIGDGLASARDQLNTTSGLPKSILVLTDGLENEPLAIAEVGGLGATQITAIGFGTESNIDGAKLTQLAQSHGGYYKRAGTGLELRKFFALAFGDIFEAGALSDPDLHLSETMDEGPWIDFDVCGEEAVTIVAGWSVNNTDLLLQVRSPTGQILNLSTSGIDNDSGQGWRFARIPLPQNGERDGKWSTRVVRVGGSGEFPPPALPTDYFITVIARGGPSLRPFEQPATLYTGDTLNPKVIFQYPDETVPHGGQVSITIRRPNASVGTILANNGLQAARVVQGDVIPAKQATLSAIEQGTGNPVAEYVEQSYTMSTSAAATGSFGHGGVFAMKLPDALVVEGSYTFHARAYLHHHGCNLTREVQWSHHVSVGIDPDSTSVTVDTDGNGHTVVTFIPQDRYGNLVGPGEGENLHLDPLPGCTLVGGVVDLGDGRYRQAIDCDSGEEGTPGVVVTQPNRDPVVLVPPTVLRRVYRYVVQFHCGTLAQCDCDCSSLAPGRYATSVSLFNGEEKPVDVVMSILPTTLAGALTGAWPVSSPVSKRDRTEIGALETTVVDCCTLGKLLLGNAPKGRQLELMASVVFDSPAPLHVTATYTMVPDAGGGASIDVERVVPEIREFREKTERPQPPAGRSEQTPSQPPPRPQDVKRINGMEPEPPKPPANEHCSEDHEDPKHRK